MAPVFAVLLRWSGTVPDREGYRSYRKSPEYSGDAVALFRVDCRGSNDTKPKLAQVWFVVPEYDGLYALPDASDTAFAFRFVLVACGFSIGRICGMIGLWEWRGSCGC